MKNCINLKVAKILVKLNLVDRNKFHKILKLRHKNYLFRES